MPASTTSSPTIINLPVFVISKQQPFNNYDWSMIIDPFAIDACCPHFATLHGGRCPNGPGTQTAPAGRSSDSTHLRKRDFFPSVAIFFFNSINFAAFARRVSAAKRYKLHCQCAEPVLYEPLETTGRHGSIIRRVKVTCSDSLTTHTPAGSSACAARDARTVSKSGREGRR